MSDRDETGETLVSAGIWALSCRRHTCNMSMAAGREKHSA